jgi:CRP-like cAMP-binding protein
MTDPLSNWMVSNQIHFSSDEIDLFRNHTHLIHVSPEAFIAKQGVRNSTIYFVRKGIVRTLTNTESKEVTLDFYQKGEFVSNSTLSDKSELPVFGIQALTEVEVYYWDPQALAYFQTHPELKSTIEKVALSEVIRKQDIRKTGLLAKSAQERYREMFHTNPAFIQQIPVKYIASYLGITPESMSRIRKMIR